MKGGDRDMYVGVTETEFSGIYRFLKNIDKLEYLNEKDKKKRSLNLWMTCEGKMS